MDQIKTSEAHRNMVLSIGGEAFLEALRIYGPSAVVEFLVKLSPKQDWLLNELLAMVPSMGIYMRFHQHTIPIACDVEILERCLKRDPDYLKKQGIL